MAVPTRTEALRLLLSLAPSPRLLQHATVTAEVAAYLARRARRAGLDIDRRAAETAALLHDIDKALPRDHVLRGRGHGHAGAVLVTEAGHPEIARAIAVHPVVRLADDDADQWVASAPLLERLVMYADKRSMQRVVSLEKRFARWYRKHPRHAERLAQAERVAVSLETHLCAELGIVATDVERTRWVGDALDRAHSHGHIGVGAVPTAPVSPSLAARGSGTVRA